MATNVTPGGPATPSDGLVTRRGKGNAARRVLSVLTGMGVIVVLSLIVDELLHRTGVMPRGKLYGLWLPILAIAYRSLFAVVGGYVAARLAPGRPMRSALALGIVGIVANIAGAFAASGQAPVWYPIALLVGALPLTWYGGKLFERRATHR